MLGFALSYYYFLVFPLCLAGFYLLRHQGRPRQYQSVALTSMLFLLMIDVQSFVILLALVLGNYRIHHYLRGTTYRTHWLTLGVVYNLLPLVVLKVMPGLIGDVAPKSLSFNVLLPIGLAFYALQQITALVDIHKKPSLHMPFWTYCFYSFFFLTVISGPIFRYQDAIAQYTTPISTRKQWYFTAKGLSLFIVGLAKFALIASPISEHLTIFFTGLTSIEGLQLTFTEGLYVLIGCLLSLYFSFSAFSDMAIGLALCFGLQLPVNFDSPLKAASPSQYINTWHMSFIQFIRLYIFQPAFKQGKKLPIRNIEHKIIFAWSSAVFLSFFLTGAWHAPTLFMMGQSAIVAFIIVITQLWLGSSSPAGTTSYLRGVSTKLLTQLVIFVTALFFFSPNIDAASAVITSVFTPSEISLSALMGFIIGVGQDSIVTFNGFFPNYAGFPHTWKASLYLPSAGLSLLHLAVALAIALTMPNTMHIFKLHHSQYTSMINIQWRLSLVQCVILAVVFYISIDALQHGQAFTYG